MLICERKGGEHATFLYFNFWFKHFLQILESDRFDCEGTQLDTKGRKRYINDLISQTNSDVDRDAFVLHFSKMIFSCMNYLCTHRIKKRSSQTGGRQLR